MIEFIKSHLKSLKDLKWNKKRIYRAYQVFREREGRGSGYFASGHEWVQVIAALVILLKGIPWIDKYMNIWTALLFFIAYNLFCYWLGYVDQHKLGFWQMDRYIEATYANPYTQNVEAKLESLENKLNELLLKKNE